VPFEHDGEDARAVIGWIARQPWSDGRVGMYGDGYGGFAAWAAAKRAPPALKAIATSAPTAPGIDFPMGGGIFRNSAFRWSLGATSLDQTVQAAVKDDAVWRALDRKWYASGRRYRDLGRIEGTPNPLFIRWLNHPSYDRYWQKMIPYRRQFAGIDIPVLTTTGYFAAGEPAALYYFHEHLRHNPHADHTLIIGPYDDAALSRDGPAESRAMPVDAAAQIDLHDLRYLWFDHVLKGAAAPPIVKDRVNYEVMGANQWRHAQSVEAMGAASVRFYLAADARGGGHALTALKPARSRFFRQTVSLLDRGDADWTPPAELVSRAPALRNGTMFESDPLRKGGEFTGTFSASLDFSVNKLDMDVEIRLYEHTPAGDYVQLFSPADAFRASYVRDRAHRHLLKAGERNHMVFASERVTSRTLQAGSRLVMVLAIGKRPDREINYGTGGDVSEESVADGKIPLRIRWYNDSYIDLPMSR
jgi:putative CocE/NonD family hydrolase